MSTNKPAARDGFVRGSQQGKLQTRDTGSDDQTTTTAGIIDSHRQNPLQKRKMVPTRPL